MPVMLLLLRSRLAVCLLYELAIGMHVGMGRFAQLHIARGRVFVRFNSDELNRLICYVVFRLQCTRAGTPERYIEQVACMVKRRALFLVMCVVEDAI